MRRRALYITAAGAIALAATGGCGTMEDFVTLFNIYYNAKRIMNDVEEPEQQPENGGAALYRRGVAAGPKNTDIPEYYEELIRKPNFDAAQMIAASTIVNKSNAALQERRLDSVVTKCTKILKFHSNSSYVPEALYMIAKAYYYKGKQTDFLYSKQKCDEFIATFPDNDLFVDAHLLAAEDLIGLKEDIEAQRALSRCIDIALPRKRYDVVGTALKYTADLALKRGDLQGAIDPYLHAMLLSGNDEANAQWQLEVAALELETQHYADAAQQFRNVFNYDPDTYPAFEAQYGLGVALRESGKTDSARDLLTDLRDTHKYADWRGYAEFALATLDWETGKTDTAAKQYARIDTQYKGTELHARANYEYAMRAMQREDFAAARERFGKMRFDLVPYAKDAQNYYNILSAQEKYTTDIARLRSAVEQYDRTTAAPGTGTRAPDTSAAQPPPASGMHQPAGAPPKLRIPAAPPPIPALAAAGAAGGRDTTRHAAAQNDSLATAQDSAARATAANDSTAAALKKRAARDTAANHLAETYYDLARMYYLLGKPDSMLAYYQHALDAAASGDVIPKTLYSLSVYYEDNGVFPAKTDSLMQIITEQYPLTPYAVLARLHLGYTEAEKIDSAATAYRSGERFMQIGDDTTAERQFWNVYLAYPQSEFAPKALYAIGWLFETKIARYDSAKHYYELLLKQYPNSEYANDIRGLFVASADTGRGTNARRPLPPANRTPNGQQQQRFEPGMMQQNLHQQPGTPPTMPIPRNVPPSLNGIPPHLPATPPQKPDSSNVKATPQ